MRIRISLLFLYLTGVANAGLEITVVNPNWQNPVIPFEKGTQITPLCDSVENTSCLKQWTHLARPFAVTSEGAKLPSMEYYLPSIVLDARLPAGTKMDGDWKVYTPSVPGSHSPSSAQTKTKYYISPSQPGRIRQVIINSEDKTKEVAEGEIVFTPVDNLVVTKGIPIGTIEKKRLKPEETDKPEERAPLIEGSVGEDMLSSGSSSDLLSDNASNAVSSNAKDNVLNSAVAKESPTPTPSQKKLDIRLNKSMDAVAGKASSPDQKSSGCIKIDKEARSSNPQDADFCVECNEHLSKNSASGCCP